VIGNQLPDTTETLVVWDTTRTGPPITVAQRHVITRTPGPAGHRRVLELLVLEHRGAGTRVGTGADGPVWAGRLPDGATDFEVGESDMSAEAVRAVDGEVWVLAPIPPGQRQLLYTYVLPGSASTMTLTLNQPVEQLTMLFEDTAAAVVSGPVADRGIEIFEDAQFRMFDGIVAGPGTTITVRYNRPRALGEGMLAALIVGAVVVGGVLIVLLRRRRRPPAADEDATALARQIAALDAEFERRAQPTAVERARYEKHRSKLKARLDQVIERV
jgi:hypothetical protein